MADGKVRIELGKLVDMVVNRIGNMREDDRHVFAQRFVAYILKTCLDGSKEYTKEVMLDLYTTVNDILVGGIVVPDEFLP